MCAIKENTAVFHINNNQEAKVCRAKKPENCRFYQDENDTRHYESVAEAQEHIEKTLAEQNGGVLKKEVRYSFVKEFKKQEDKFNKDFDGIPKRFFNADLRDKHLPHDIDDAELLLGRRSFNVSGLNLRLINSVSQPSDSKISDEEAVELLTEQGFENAEKIDDSNMLKTLKTQRAWKVSLEGKDFIVIDGNAGTHLDARYAFRTNNEFFKAYSYWNKLDLRKIAGNQRVEQKTGVNILANTFRTQKVVEAEQNFKNQVKDYVDELYQGQELSEEEQEKVLESVSKVAFKRMQSIDALTKLEEAQLEGKNFIAQKKYVKDNDNPSVATVWQEKKDTDDIRKDLAKNSKLNNYFKKLDLDNDVDPSEFAEFEKDYLEIVDKLPKFPKGKEPSLHIRKLGKHSGGNFHVHGLFNPNKNAIAISVTGEGKSSAIHEIYHHYDLITKNNISLSPEFQELSKTYDSTLKMPAGLENKEQYYKTKTEQFSRFAEVWMSERKGVNNSLINSSKFENFDYAPLQNNPEFKKKVFDFFDKLHNEDQTN